MSVPVALLHVANYSQPDLRHSVFTVLDAASLHISQGQKILVKPNLLMAHDLTCTQPVVVAAACEWLLNHGARVSVSDSPAFGTCESVASSIGLTELLKPLGLSPKGFRGHRKITLDVEGHPTLTVATESLECDALLSIPRVKAHSQMRLTLAVKNCYGCIPGMRKAIAHSRFGSSVDHFSQCVVAFWRQLPPVMALADGVVAMHVTGPRNGEPYSLGLLGAAASAPALDTVIMAILGVDAQSVPLAKALAGVIDLPDPCYPLEQPSCFAAPDFQVPKTLKEISFSPRVLVRSIARRLWAQWRGVKESGV